MIHIKNQKLKPDGKSFTVKVNGVNTEYDIDFLNTHRANIVRTRSNELQELEAIIARKETITTEMETEVSDVDALIDTYNTLVADAKQPTE